MMEVPIVISWIELPERVQKHIMEMFGLNDMEFL
jgi:hypothetical protein